MSATPAIRAYALVTAVYWVFTLTDGALRMLVLLHFHERGFHAVALALLFVLYESCGVVTNLFGGWLAARLGLHVTLWAGTALQIIALLTLVFLQPDWGIVLASSYVMVAQALSGIAKDLTKMSAKSAIKTLVPAAQDSRLFRWVALLTGSKNALKGVGFFLGGLLLSTLGFQVTLLTMAGVLAVMLVISIVSLPRRLGVAKRKTSWKTLFAKTPAINRLSAARFFLFAARDTWFVVGVPIFLAETLGWNFTAVGGFLAAWVIGYGIVQAATPLGLGVLLRGAAPGRGTAIALVIALAAVMAAIPIARQFAVPAAPLLILGLGIFGVVFALNSAVHSYLILAYADHDEVATDVGFYYMANAGGRLLGTLLSGVLFFYAGLDGCLWAAAVCAACAGLLTLGLPRSLQTIPLTALADSGE